MIRETERLILRKFRNDDAKRVTDLLQDKRISDTTQNIPYPYTEQMAIDWIGMHGVWFANKHSYTLAVVLKDTHELIGVVSLSHTDGVGEIGYWYGVDYWNKGYGTEAAQAMLDYAFTDLNYHKVYGRFLTTNPASGKIMKHLNMKKEGTLKQHILKDNEYIDVDMYAILKTEYMKQGLWLKSPFKYTFLL